jgi:hypothetical protein
LRAGRQAESRSGEYSIRNLERVLVQNIEELSAELEGGAFKQPGVLRQRKIEIAVAGVPEGIAAHIAWVRRYCAAIEVRQVHREKLSHEVLVGATFVGSIATAFFVQRAVLGAMLRAFGRHKAARR